MCIGYYTLVLWDPRVIVYWRSSSIGAREEGRECQVSPLLAAGGLAAGHGGAPQTPQAGARACNKARRVCGATLPAGTPQQPDARRETWPRRVAVSLRRLVQPQQSSRTQLHAHHCSTLTARGATTHQWQPPWLWKWLCLSRRGAQCRLQLQHQELAGEREMEASMKETQERRGA